MTLGPGGGRVGVAETALRVAGAGVAAVAAVRVGVAAGRVVAALVDRGVVVLDGARVAAAAVDVGRVDGDLARGVVRGRAAAGRRGVAAGAARRVAARCAAVATEADDVTVGRGDVVRCLGRRLGVGSGRTTPVAADTGRTAAGAVVGCLRGRRAIGLTGSVLRGRGCGRRPCGGKDQCSCCDVPLLAHIPWLLLVDVRRQGHLSPGS